MCRARIYVCVDVNLRACVHTCEHIFEDELVTAQWVKFEERKNKSAVETSFAQTRARTLSCILTIDRTPK